MQNYEHVSVVCSQYRAMLPLPHVASSPSALGGLATETSLADGRELAIEPPGRCEARGAALVVVVWVHAAPLDEVQRNMPKPDSASQLSGAVERT